MSVLAEKFNEHLNKYYTFVVQADLFICQMTLEQLSLMLDMYVCNLFS